MIERIILTSGGGPWDIVSAQFSQREDINANTSDDGRGIFFKPDGTAFYITQRNSPGNVDQYSMSIAWDIGTSSYVRTLNVSAQDTEPRDVFFKDDGTKMYILGAVGIDVNEYDLSTAWNISTASYLQNFSVSSQELFPESLFFKDDGTKMYILGFDGKDVNEYDLSSAWDISTASYLQNFSVSSQVPDPTGLFFKPDGTKMYLINNDNDIQIVSEYNLSTPWNVTSASFFNSKNFSDAAESDKFGIFFKPDGTKMFMSGRDESTGTRRGYVYEYTL